MCSVPVGAGVALSGGGFLSRRFGSAFVPVGAGVDEAWSGDACVALVLSLCTRSPPARATQASPPTALTCPHNYSREYVIEYRRKNQEQKQRRERNDGSERPVICPRVG